jgi:hypothetical protein
VIDHFYYYFVASFLFRLSLRLLGFLKKRSQKSDCRQGRLWLPISLERATTCKSMVSFSFEVVEQRICLVSSEFTFFWSSLPDIIKQKNSFMYVSDTCFPLTRYKLIRGQRDLGPVAGRTRSRSKYGSEFSSLFQSFPRHTLTRFFSS